MRTDRDYIDFRRPRGVADTVNATFYFFRNEFRPLAKALVYIAGPVVALAAVFMAIEHRFTFGIFASELGVVPEPVSLVTVVGFTVSLVAAYYLIIGVAFAYADLYVSEGRGGLAPREVWQRFRSSLGRYVSSLLWIGLLFVLLTLSIFVPIVGWLFFLIVGCYLAPLVMMVIPARFDRREGFWTAYRRVRDQLMESWWRAFGVFVVTFVIVSAAGVGSILGIEFLYLMTADFIHGGVLGTIGMSLLSLVNMGWYVLYVIPAVAFVIYYFGLIEAAEATGLEARIEAMAVPEPAAVAE